MAIRIYSLARRLRSLGVMFALLGAIALCMIGPVGLGSEASNVRQMVRLLVRVTGLLFWVAAALEVVALNLLDVPFVASVLMLTVVASSGVLTRYGFRHSTKGRTYGGRLADKDLLRALGHTITFLFLTFDYVAVVY